MAKKRGYDQLQADIQWLKDLKEQESSDQLLKRRAVRKSRRLKHGKARWVRREENRRKQLPPNNICAHCNRGPLRSKQFVIKQGFVGCLICWRKRNA